MEADSLVDAARLPVALVRWFAESTDQGLFATDRNLQIIVWNRWMEIHTGEPASAMLGRSLLELYPDLTARGLDQYYRDALAGRVGLISQGLHRYVVRMRPTNHGLSFDEMPQNARIGPLLDGQDVIGTVTTLDDVSDRLKSEAELRKQLDIQQRARVTAEQALRAKDEFLSTVSHELRTPLNAVLGWTRILIDRQDIDADMLARALDVIHRNAAAQVRLIDDLLDVARIASGKLRLELQPVDLLAVALAVADVIAPAAKTKQIDLRTNLDLSTPSVLGDPQRLQQILWNLLSNAVKFTDRGVVELRVSPAEKFARVTVADTGRGIAPDFLPFVFERFRQSDSSSSRRHGGLGLGLALVRELVELHGGTVKAESPGEQQGATFTIELPAVLSPSIRQNDHDAIPRTLAEAPSLAGLRILVVDDERDSRQLLSEILEKRGAEVAAAGSCEEALAAVHGSAAAHRPHVILSDLGMPGADGYDLIREIRALPADGGGRIPAIAVTGYANQVDRQRALAAGYQSHLAKPIDPVALVVALSRVAADAAFREHR
jgi:PAS domain S-box-containing protein